MFFAKLSILKNSPVIGPPLQFIILLQL